MLKKKNLNFKNEMKRKEKKICTHIFKILFEV